MESTHGDEAREFVAAAARGFLVICDSRFAHLTEEGLTELYLGKFLELGPVACGRAFAIRSCSDGKLLRSRQSEFVEGLQSVASATRKDGNDICYSPGTSPTLPLHYSAFLLMPTPPTAGPSLCDDSTGIYVIRAAAAEGGGGGGEGGIRGELVRREPHGLNSMLRAADKKGLPLDSNVYAGITGAGYFERFTSGHLRSKTLSGFCIV